MCYDPIFSGFIGMLPDRPVIIPVEVLLDVGACTGPRVARPRRGRGSDGGHEQRRQRDRAATRPQRCAWERPGAVRAKGSSFGRCSCVPWWPGLWPGRWRVVARVWHGHGVVTVETRPAGSCKQEREWGSYGCAYGFLVGGTLAARHNGGSWETGSSGLPVGLATRCLGLWRGEAAE